jgi:hypothetical protein
MYLGSVVIRCNSKVAVVAGTKYNGCGQSVANGFHVSMVKRSEPRKT